MDKLTNHKIRCQLKWFRGQYSVLKKCPVDLSADAENMAQLLNGRLEVKKMFASRVADMGFGRINGILKNKIAVAIRPIIGRNYRNASSSWVDVVTKIDIEIAESVSATGDSEDVWSDNGKWRASNAVYKIAVKRDWLKMPIELRGAGGLLTLEAELVEKDLWKAIWVTQGKGFGLKINFGYIARVDLGGGSSMYLRAKTESAARKMARTY